MRLTFLGTRGNIRVSSAEHRYHAMLLVEAEDVRVLVDAGDDWRGTIEAFEPDAILLTHAHPDHAGALRDGAPCPVYATAATHALLARYPIEWRVIGPAVREHLGPLTFSAHQVAHSLRAPAVGYRLEHHASHVFYVPDVLTLIDARSALLGVQLYVGDGATYGRPIVREREGEAFGHTTIESQLGWCAENGVRRAIFTHCGSRVVRADPAEVEARIAAAGASLGVEASLAHDGDAIEVAAGHVVPV